MNDMDSVGMYKSKREKTMKRVLILFAIIAVILTGCTTEVSTSDYDQQTEDTKTPTATPTTISTPTPEPIEFEEESEDIVAQDPFEDFTAKIAGVWGNLTGGCYFENYEDSDISSGWFESDALPQSHIRKVIEVAENVYRVTIEVDSSYDEDGNAYDGYSYEVTYDGSADGFEKSFIASNDTTDYLYIRLGNNMDEAWEYYTGTFIEDYNKLAENYKGKLKESPVGIWYTENYDLFDNWAESYSIELSGDGNALCTGWRNKDSGIYEITEPGKLRITFDHCEIDNPEIGGWDLVEGFVYTIDMDYSGNDATIKINAPDVITNLTDGVLHRKAQ